MEKPEQIHWENNSVIVPPRASLTWWELCTVWCTLYIFIETVSCPVHINLFALLWRIGGSNQFYKLAAHF